MVSFGDKKRIVKYAVLLSLCLSLSGCDFGKWLADVLNAIGMAPEKTVRISGETYFKYPKKSADDTAFSQNGYLCVVHDPGCGDLTGEDGEDTFFLARQLPPLATVTSFTFEPVPPSGMNASYEPGPSGSFDTVLEPGVLDGSQPIKIRWHNACWGPYGGKKAVYRVSINVKIKGNIDLGEAQYDPATKVDVPACRSPDQSIPPACVSGTISNVQITMNRISATPDGLIYAGTTDTGLSSTCTNLLQTISAAQVNVPVMPLKKDKTTCADAATRLGTGIKIETTEDDQIAIFGEAHPKHPITLRACVAAGANPPTSFNLIAVFKVQ